MFCRMVLTVALVLAQAPECVKNKDCPAGQTCVGGACKVSR